MNALSEKSSIQPSALRVIYKGMMNCIKLNCIKIYNIKQAFKFYDKPQGKKPKLIYNILQMHGINYVLAQ